MIRSRLAKLFDAGNVISALIGLSGAWMIYCCALMINLEMLESNEVKWKLENVMHPSITQDRI